MGMRWRLALPVFGLILFGGVTCNSFNLNREIQRSANRYFWWSSVRLDSDPLNRHALATVPCKDGEKCASWTPAFIWVEPGWFAKSLMLAAFPAFVVGAVVLPQLELEKAFFR
jgi:hypothetical protein